MGVAGVPPLCKRGKRVGSDRECQAPATCTDAISEMGISGCAANSCELPVAVVSTRFHQFYGLLSPPLPFQDLFQGRAFGSSRCFPSGVLFSGQSFLLLVRSLLTSSDGFGRKGVCCNRGTAYKYSPLLVMAFMASMTSAALGPLPALGLTAAAATACGCFDVLPTLARSSSKLSSGPACPPVDSWAWISTEPWVAPILS